MDLNSSTLILFSSVIFNFRMINNFCAKVHVSSLIVKRSVENLWLVTQ